VGQVCCQFLPQRGLRSTNGMELWPVTTWKKSGVTASDTGSELVQDLRRIFPVQFLQQFLQKVSFSSGAKFVWNSADILAHA